MGKTRKSLGDDMSFSQRLTSACINGDLAAIKKMVEEEIKNDVKQLDKTDIDDARGQTPLIVAARYGHYEVVQHLLQLGVRVDSIQQSGATALTYNCSSRRLSRDLCATYKARSRCQYSLASISNNAINCCG